MIEHVQNSQFLPTGTMLAGRYRVEGQLGAGGMGAVYRGFDEQLQRLVALKLLNESKRLDREAAAMAQLTHPNIVKIHSIDVLEGDARFLVLEYVEGRTLRDIVEQDGPIPAARTIEITQQVLQALAHAHQQRVVHRDLKPQNVMIDKHANVKVLDFGIAKLIGTDGQRVTQTGEIIGTPEYISPEQCTAGDITAATDIYALGCCMYYMLTGTPPFHGQSVMEVFLKQLHEPPPPAQNADEGLAEVIAKAMAKDPAARFQSAEEMSEAIRTRRVGGSPMSASKPTGDRKALPKRVSAVGAATVGIFLGIILSNLLPHEATTQPPLDHEHAFRELKIIGHHFADRKISPYDLAELQRMEPVMTAESANPSEQIEYASDCVAANLLLRNMPEYERHARRLLRIKCIPKMDDHFDRAALCTLLSFLTSEGRILEGLEIIDQQRIEATEGGATAPQLRTLEYDALTFAKRNRLLSRFEDVEKKLTAGGPLQVRIADYEVLRNARDEARRRELRPTNKTGDYGSVIDYLEAPHSFQSPALRAHAFNTWGDGLRFEGETVPAKNRYEHALDEARAGLKRKNLSEFEKMGCKLGIEDALDGLAALKSPAESARAALRDAASPAPEDAY